MHPSLANLKDHTGSPLPPEAEFFHPPPSELGELLSASSNLKATDRPVTPKTRRIALLVGGVGGLVIGLLLDLIPAIGNWIYVWPPFLAFSGFMVAEIFTRFEYECSYIGRQGAAMFQCQGSRDKIQKILLLYADMEEVGLEFTTRRSAGKIIETYFDFRCTDHGKPCRWRFNTPDEHPPSTDPYHFFNAVVTGWCQAYFPRELARHGYVELAAWSGLKQAIGLGPTHIRIAPTSIEIRSGADATSYPRTDINTLSFDGALRLVVGNGQTVEFVPAPGQAGILLRALETIAGLTLGAKAEVEPPVYKPASA